MVLESVLVSFYKWLTSTECVLSLFTDKKKSPDALGSSLKFTKPRGEAAVTSTAANTALLSEPFWVPGTTGCHQPLNRLALNTPRLLGLWDTAGWTTEAASVLSLVTIPCVCACPVVLELLPHPAHTWPAGPIQSRYPVNLCWMDECSSIIKNDGAIKKKLRHLVSTWSLGFTSLGSEVLHRGACVMEKIG